jgi:plasmid stability protein
MRKTTICLPDELKAALSRAASARGCSQAELLREALRNVLATTTAPQPRLPLFHSRKPSLAQQLDRALAGFGER